MVRLDAVLLEQLAERAPLLAGQTRCTRNVAAGLREQALQLAALEGVQHLLLGFVEIERRRAAEAAIGLAILVCFFRNRGTIDVEDVNVMKG